MVIYLRSFCFLFAILCSFVTYSSDYPFIVGAGIHVGQQKSLSQEAIPLLSSGGFNGFRDDISWGRLERNSGNIFVGKDLDELHKTITWGAKNARALLILDYGNPAYDEGRQPYSELGRYAFAKYAKEVVKKYSDMAYGFEIWNEWNIGSGNPKPNNRWGDPIAYAKLVAVTSQGIREVAPNARILCGGLADGDLKWLEKILSEGVLSYCDSISIHPYVFSNGSKAEPKDSFALIDSAWGLISRYKNNKDVKVSVTELGWPSHVGKGGHAQNLVASYAVQSFFLAKDRPWIDGLWWYELIDSGDFSYEREHNFGLVKRSLETKPVFKFIAALSPYLISGKRKSSGVLSNGRYWVRLTINSKEELTAFWSSGGGEENFKISFVGGSASATLVLDNIRFPKLENSNVLVGAMPVVIRHLKNTLVLE